MGVPGFVMVSKPTFTSLGGLHPVVNPSFSRREVRERGGHRRGEGRAHGDRRFLEGRRAPQGVWIPPRPGWCMETPLEIWVMTRVTQFLFENFHDVLIPKCEIWTMKSSMI